MMGYEREEIEGHSLLDFLQDPKDAAKIEKQLSATGKWEGELVAKKKDGSTMDIHLSASVVKDNSDKPICIISSFIDISESKKIHQELTESESKLKAIFDLVPIGIYVVNEDGRVIEANQSFIDFMGLSLEELYQKKHWDRKYFSADGTALPNPMDTKDNLYRNFPAGEVMHGKKPSKQFEIGMEKENGEIVWTSAVAVPIPISNWAALCVAMDITDKKKMERELKEREERFRKVFELSPIGIQLFDVEGFLVSANQTSQKIMGVTDTVKHKRHNIFRDVLKDAESQLKLLSGQIITEGVWIKIDPKKAVKLKKLDKDSLPNNLERIYIENIAATLGEADKPDGYICIQRDLTEHRLASEAMMSENERLQIIYDIWKTRVKTSDLRMND
jgi:PAS domain S-box-containing protein